MTSADVRFEHDDRTMVAVLTGEIDMSNATSVRQEIAESVTPEHDALIVELSELSFIDSAGLHALIELGTILEEHRQQLLLAIPPGSQIERAIQIVGLPQAISIHADRGEALEAARSSAMESRPIGPSESA